MNINLKRDKSQLNQITKLVHLLNYIYLLKV